MSLGMHSYWMDGWMDIVYLKSEAGGQCGGQFTLLTIFKEPPFTLFTAYYLYYCIIFDNIIVRPEY